MEALELESPADGVLASREAIRLPEMDTEMSDAQGKIRIHSKGRKKGAVDKKNGGVFT